MASSVTFGSVSFTGAVPASPGSCCSNHHQSASASRSSAGSPATTACAGRLPGPNMAAKDGFLTRRRSTLTGPIRSGVSGKAPIRRSDSQKAITVDVTPVPFVPKTDAKIGSDDTESATSGKGPEAATGKPETSGLFGGLRRALLFQQGRSMKMPTAASFASSFSSSSSSGSSTSLGNETTEASPPLEHRDEVVLGWAPFDRRRFLAQHVLGAGGYGTVYEAFDTARDMRVALKVVPKNSSKQQAPLSASQVEKTRTRLRSEAGLMELLPEGSNCVRLLDKFEDANNAYLVLEHLEGTTLDGFLDVEKPTEEELQSIFRQVLGFIQACHDAGLVFGDIKPANFMVLRTDEGIRVTAVDFGCAQLVHPGKQLSYRIGTFKYFSPEVYNQSYGKAADLWSAGIMMYRIMARAYPWWALREQLTPKEAQGFVCSSQAVPFREKEWDTWSPAAQDLAELLLNKDASARCTANEALEHPWFSPEETKLGNIVPLRSRNAAAKAIREAIPCR